MIKFTELKNLVDDELVELSLNGTTGRSIDGSKRPGDITLYIGSKDANTESLVVIDLDLPIARALATALVELVKWVEQTDAAERRKRKGKD